MEILMGADERDEWMVGDQWRFEWREGNHVLLFILLHQLAEFKDMR